MNGLHDLGGMQGFGPVAPEQNEPIFHAAWEGRVFALALAMGKHFGITLDRSRFLMESSPPADLIALSYYERWANRLFRVAEMRGILTAGESATCRHGVVPEAGSVRATPVTGQELGGLFHTIRSSSRPIAAAPAFAIGETVRAKVMNPKGHTRLPRYARGKAGIVIADHGGHVFPDTNALDPPQENPCRLYTVKFSARELWGEDGSARDSVCIDLWERYLERL